MKPLTINEIAKAVGGQVNSPYIGEELVYGVSFDTRQELEGKIFVPLIGLNADGHKFIPVAMRHGAVCCFSQIETSVPAIMVRNTQRALSDLAAYYRSLFDIPVIGITGSNGKTSTKDMVASVLSQKYNVVKTIGNFNNNIGLPATIFNIDDKTEVLVLEMGMNHRYEISELSRIARPSIAAITNIGVAHIENLGSQEEIFKAKSEILEHLQPNGKLVLNGDDQFLLRHSMRPNTVFVGFSENNFYRAINEQTKGLAGASYTLETKNGRGCEIYVPSAGRHMISNSLIAVAIGEELGLGLDEMKEGIKMYKPSGMRMNIIKTDKGLHIIDDCYNSNPDSAKAALDVLATASGGSVAILGDMYELGDEGAQMHYELGKYAVALGINTIICIGKYSKDTYHGACEQVREYAENTTVMHFDEKSDCINMLSEVLQAEDTILVKASRGMKFEEIVNYLISFRDL